MDRYSNKVNPISCGQVRNGIQKPFKVQIPAVNFLSAVVVNAIHDDSRGDKVNCLQFKSNDLTDDEN